MKIILEKLIDKEIIKIIKKIRFDKNKNNKIIKIILKN